MKEETSMSGKAYAIYARAEKDAVRHSLQRQIRNCMTYVEEEGGTVVAVHAERSCGCEPSQRPELRALLDLIDDGGIDYLVCESLDRLCRPVTNYIALRDRLDANGVEVLTVAGASGTYRTQKIAEIISAHMRSDIAMRIRRGKAMAKALRR
ncbi:recombinase family protein [Croceicoccus sp. F390]|uniref:Recombinase family protein n=1 Tax=Croceicoccus esteveae TaxID=3075597 RepID=A0ABU2ZKR4_9SPHN|nr:recombinase family protein [Croceicoccus sp. F390]MDT0577180.1 recombinase family protein [Croceicoccus sp. F390]